MKRNQNSKKSKNPLVGIDRAQILWLNTHDFLPAKPVPGAACQRLSADDIERLSRIKDFDIDEQLVSDFNALGFTAFGMFVEKKLAGISFFAAGELPARYNKRGDNFAGLDIVIPPGTRCLFKAVVLPQYRGNRLHSAVVRYAIDEFGKDTVHTIIATCAATNKAFLASSLDQGFEKVGQSAEFRILTKSFYRLPKPIDSVNGEVTTDEDRSILLRKAA